jgi:HK97 family phage portal protein
MSEGLLLPEQGREVYREFRNRPPESDDYWYTPLRELTHLKQGSAGVTASNATQIATVFSCIRLLSFSGAALPLILYKSERDGGKTRAKEDKKELFQLFKNRPNQKMTSFHWKQVTLAHLLLSGNSYHQIIRNRAKGVVELPILDPGRMTKEEKDGKVMFKYKEEGSSKDKVLSADKVAHYLWWSDDGFTGKSPIEACSSVFSLSKRMQDHADNYFKNGSIPSGYLRVPGVFKNNEAATRLREQWLSKTGPENTGKPVILEGGLDWVQAGLKHSDAQFLEQWKFTKEMIASIYGVPLHMIQDLSRATFSNIEQQALDYVIWSLLPLLRIIEETINRFVLEELYPEYFVEFLVSSLLRGDIQSRYNAYMVGRQWGWLSANDIRAMENMNPIENGDMYLVPLNMQTAERAANPLVESGKIERGRQALAEALHKVLSRDKHYQESLSKMPEGSDKRAEKESAYPQQKVDFGMQALFTLSEFYVECVNTRNTRTSPVRVGEAVTKFILEELRYRNEISIEAQKQELAINLAERLEGLLK